uniref:Uncharacterized protein n=1 Tax=Anguilla anguilla TaxID=7936 RepID=A0A0E9UDG1_ANGAN
MQQYSVFSSICEEEKQSFCYEDIMALCRRGLI